MLIIDFTKLLAWSDTEAQPDADVIWVKAEDVKSVECLYKFSLWTNKVSIDVVFLGEDTLRAFKSVFAWAHY